QALQEGAGGLLMHTAAQRRQVEPAAAGALPDLEAEKDIRPVGPGGERLGAADLVMDRMGRLAGGAHMGIAFRHGRFLLTNKQGIRPLRPYTLLLYCARGKMSMQ